MKKIIKYLLIFICIFSLSSCNKNNSNSNQENNNHQEQQIDYEFELPTERVHIHTGEAVNIIATGEGTLVTASDVVDAVADSVVEISIEIVTTNRWTSYVSSAAGSGVIFDSQGYIVTNHHVVDGANNIQVTLRNGTTYTANLVASDAEDDLAVLFIDPNEHKDVELKYAVFGNSDNLRVAQDVIAIGNPLGSLGGSVTKGVISALDRKITIDDYTMRLLQIDCAINPGNSGGALFDMTGHLVGVVNAKSTGEEIDGIGFAIPSNHALEVITSLLEFGYIKGRTCLPIDTVFGTYRLDPFGLQTITGLFVQASNETIGVSQNDLIYKIDDIIIQSNAEAIAILRSKSVGDSVKLTIYTNSSTYSSTIDINVNLIEFVPSNK